MISNSKNRNRATDIKSRTEWYRHTFSDDYLWLYAHRSDSEAYRQAKVAAKMVSFRSGQEVLDVGCGAGRHMLAFARLGAKVTGLDLSPQLLKTARQKLKDEGMKAKFLHQDIRSLRINEKFDGVMLWFTSFGYFPRISDDKSALICAVTALKPDGWWWIDLPNPCWLKRNLVAESARVVDGPFGQAQVAESRKISRNKVIKKTIISDSKGVREYLEIVRLYRPEQFGALVKSVGLKTDGILGDYTGAALSPEFPRQIWFGRK